MKKTSVVPSKPQSDSFVEPWDRVIRWILRNIALPRVVGSMTRPIQPVARSFPLLYVPLSQLRSGEVSPFLEGGTELEGGAQSYSYSLGLEEKVPCTPD